MTVPLIVLAIASALGGFWGIDTWLARQYGASAGEASNWVAHLVEPFKHAPVAAFGGLLAVGVGFGAAWALYRGAVSDPLPAKLGVLARWMRDRFYFDELYARLIALTQDAAARLADTFDRWILAGAVVKGTHGAVQLLGRLLRLVQTGSLQVYAMLFAVGVIVVLFFAVNR
jgi:NADH-quinone oxidoreductase subunit L